MTRLCTRIQLSSILLLVLAGTSPVHAQTDSVLPWRVGTPPTGEYGFAVDHTVARGGRSSLRIDGYANSPFGAGLVLQQVRADRYRGQRVRASAYLRVRDVRGAGASIAVAVPGNGVVLLQSNTDQSPVTGTTDWQRVSTEVDVPDAAAGLNLTVSLNGSGTLWVDDFALEPAGPATALTTSPSGAMPAQVQALNEHFSRQSDIPRALDFEDTEIAATLGRSPLEAPRALSRRGLDNLTAFARLVGVVRHFHPMDAMRTTNWDDFTIRAVRRVEEAPSADSLARTLRALFAAVAPDVTIETGSRALPARIAAASAAHAKPAVAVWRNTGITLTAPTPARPTIYQSVLALIPTPDGKLPDGTPHPDSAWSAPLGAGVVARVPLARWVEAPADSTVHTAVQPGAVSEPASPSDRATRLAGVIGTWNVFQHSYPYFDVVKVDWPAELRSALSSAATDRGPDDYQATLRRLVAAVQDGHGNVNALVAGPRRAYLPVALDWVENRLVVTRTASDTSSLRRGDVIEQVDGVRVDALLARREELISGATPQWRRYRAVTELAFDTMGKSITLRVRSPGTNATREVRATYNGSRVTEALPDKIAELRPGIFYVDLDRITDADYVAALPRLQQAHGIVFDMRGYPRTVGTPAILMRLAADTVRSAHFEPPTFTRPDRESVEWFDGAWVLPPMQPRLTARIAFITGGGAISYAESTMGIVEQYRLGEIVGAATAGTNGNINIFTATGGYQVVFTGMRVRKRDGSPHHGVGIKPTIPVSRTLTGVSEGRDELLERALAVVDSVHS